MLYDTVAEYDQAIAETQAAISRTVTAGSSRSVGSSGGSNRSTTETELAQLRQHLGILQAERQALRSSEASGEDPGAGTCYLGAAW